VYGTIGANWTPKYWIYEFEAFTDEIKLKVSTATTLPTYTSDLSGGELRSIVVSIN